MKNLKPKITLAVMLTVFSVSSFAQNWRVGGNTNAQLGGSSPIIGTIGTNPLNFITNNAQRMTITATTGFVGTLYI